MTERTEFEKARDFAAARYSARLCGTPVDRVPNHYQGDVPIADFVDKFPVPQRASQHKDAWQKFFRGFGEFWASHKVHRQRMNA